MENDETEYSRWVALANDPSQSEHDRQRYRAQMQAYVHRELRKAFRLASQQTQRTRKEPAVR